MKAPVYYSLIGLVAVPIINVREVPPEYAVAKGRYIVTWVLDVNAHVIVEELNEVVPSGIVTLQVLLCVIVMDAGKVITI